MAESKEDILEEFGFVIGSHEFSSTKKWYAGITSDPRERLFSDHKVDENDTEDWACMEANNVEDAREIEKILHSDGFQGGPGGGDDDSKYVYIYRITKDTVE